MSTQDYPEHLNPFREEVCLREPKQRGFWTFGRSRKRNSFRATWSHIFGKRKERSDRRTTVSAASPTVAHDATIGSQVSRDRQEFDEAFGTLARRRKYTLDDGSRYGSSLTVNGEPARIYEGSPRETTTSIMGHLTPKPPARRFGQVSPRPTDKIPSLDFAKTPDSGVATPVVPKRRSKVEGREPRDENENVREEYEFSQFRRDPTRQSNVSINSCVSVGSVASVYGRKKRRAPQPPLAEVRNRSVIEEQPAATEAKEAEDSAAKPAQRPQDPEATVPRADQPERTEKESDLSTETEQSERVEPEEPIKSTEPTEEPEEVESPSIEYERCVPERLEIHVDDVVEMPARKLSRSDSFSVKEEIEKIERQIRALETTEPEERALSSRHSIEENRRHFFKDLVNEPVEMRRPSSEPNADATSEPIAGYVARKPIKVVELHISEPIRPTIVDEYDVNPVPKPRRHSAIGQSASNVCSDLGKRSSNGIAARAESV